uniref:Uncharacterized protein LOC114348630 n=1 Tax=Diabrotica virgifera virgifera TaxID=50390 RepID=A0A6P7GYZ6_DIAVI
MRTDRTPEKAARKSKSEAEKISKSEGANSSSEVPEVHTDLEQKGTPVTTSKRKREAGIGPGQTPERLESVKKMRTELQKLKETITEVLRLTKVNPNTKVEIKTEVAGLDWQLTRLERSLKEIEGEVADMSGNKKKKSKESSVCTTSEGTQTFASMAPTSIDIGIQTNLEEEFSEEQRVARIEKSMNEGANASAEDIMVVISEDWPEALFRRTIRKEGSSFLSGSDVAVAIT